MTRQPPNLFDAADLPQPATIVPQGSIEANFQAFHEANPWVYEALVELSMDMHRHPGRPYDSGLSMGMLFEVLRWQYRRATTDEHSDFKLNNNYRSRYARLIMEQEDDLEGVFQIRELTTPKTGTTSEPSEARWIGNNVIIRSADSGVHWGALAARDGNTVVLEDSRRLHYWSGAFTLTAIANSGVSKPDDCRFSDYAPEIMVFGVCEVLPTSAKADESLAAVKVHDPS